MALYMSMIWLLSIQLLLLIVVVECKGKVPAIIVFGDSTVDAGNNNHIPTFLRSNFKPYGQDFEGGRPTGRFCNGRMATDFLSEAFGLGTTVPAYLDPAYNISDFAVGVSFASAGTGYDNTTARFMRVLPLWKEIDYFKEYHTQLKAYLGENKANETLTEALYATSFGTNDFLENYYPLWTRRLEFSEVEYQDFLIGIAKNFVTTLYELGARKFSLGGLPPMGCLPLERARNFLGGKECVESYNKVARDFNDRLRNLTMELNDELSGIRVIFANPYPILMQMIRKPSLYGFEETSVGCCARDRLEMGFMCDRLRPAACKDASKFVFWDSIHTTERANSVIADHLFKKALFRFLLI